MNKSEKPLKIQTLGRFNIYVDGRSVAEEWPDETSRMVFCSLLSPLDLYITWDRICRSTWDVPVTRTNRRRLEETILRPLNSFLVKELGFNPLIIDDEGIKFNHNNVYLDALEFHKTVVDGLKELSLGNFAQAIKKINMAESLYAGQYLPGMTGKIITNTRNDLDSLFHSAVMVVLPKLQFSSFKVLKRKFNLGMPGQVNNNKIVLKSHEV